jgi:predicted nucleic acid-binding protein
VTPKKRDRQEPVAIAAITAAELFYGVEHAGHAARRARRGAFVEGLLATVPVVAATALAHDFALATLNTTEFGRVAGLRLV